MMRAKFAAGRSYSNFLILGAVLAALSACGMPKSEPKSMADIGAGSVLVVGAVELDPPLRPNERDINMPNDLFNTAELMSNRAVMWAADDPRAVRSITGHSINPELGSTFFFSIPRGRPYLVDGQITTSMAGFVERRIVLPTPMRVEMRDTDRAIYIGTLRLTRDAFNEVVSVEIIDEYGQAAREFSQRFGPGHELRRALLQVPGL